jgi:hypothetical protein
MNTAPFGPNPGDNASVNEATSTVNYSSELGEVAYEAYVVAMRETPQAALTVFPAWKELPLHERIAWHEAGQAAVWQAS